jgi:hypothetical protein
LFHGIRNLKPYPSLRAYLKFVSMSLDYLHHNIGRGKEGFGDEWNAHWAIVLYEALNGSFKRS